jgi:LmbE family N-acetylglucosaminyl deacetylase
MTGTVPFVRFCFTVAGLIWTLSKALNVFFHPWFFITLLHMEPISRRQMLGLAGVAGTTMAMGLPVAAAEAEHPSRKLKIVVTGGHPGDPEYGCGGTIARYSDLGHELVLLYLNEGDPADKPGPKRLRVIEASRACEILKARPAYAGQIDGQAVVDPGHYEAFRGLLQAENPNVVFTHWPIDNHADHRAISLLVYDAWLHLGRTFALYYYEVSNGEDTVQFAPTHYVDISKTEPRKRAACYAHASQAPDRYYSLQESVTRLRGIESGNKLAEGFIRHIQSPDFALPFVS